MSQHRPAAPCAACAEKDREITCLKDQMAEVIKVYKNNQGLMTTRMYRIILALIHPHQHSGREEQAGEAFMLWKSLEGIIPFDLTFEERTGTPKAKMPPPLPKTTREMWEAREKARQERSARAKRGAATRKARQQTQPPGYG